MKRRLAERGGAVGQQGGAFDSTVKGLHVVDVDGFPDPKVDCKRANKAQQNFSKPGDLRKKNWKR